MEKQNVTLSLPQKLLQKFKLLAVRRGRSMSGLMAEMIAEAVAAEEGYQAARRRHSLVRDLSFWHIQIPNAGDVLGAIDLQRRYQLSFWDAMIVRSAADCGESPPSVHRAHPQSSSDCAW